MIPDHDSFTYNLPFETRSLYPGGLELMSLFLFWASCFTYKTATSVWRKSLLKYSFFPLVFQAGIGSLSEKEGPQGRIQKQPLSLWLLLWSRCISSGPSSVCRRGNRKEDLGNRWKSLGLRRTGGEERREKCLCRQVRVFERECMCVVGSGCMVFLAILLGVEIPGG